MSILLFSFASPSGLDRPSSSFERPASTFDEPPFERPASTYEKPPPTFQRPSSNFERPASSFERPPPAFDRPPAFERPFLEGNFDSGVDDNDKAFIPPVRNPPRTPVKKPTRLKKMKKKRVNQVSRPPVKASSIPKRTKPTGLFFCAAKKPYPKPLASKKKLFF